ncbi:T-complex protein 1 subunit zeta-like [Palaemon carinicauda]|uniref:T-complex protein 1 subunit zeta-like n=1 Tax=Palaemon carinicauda TaxID=392227 RepID=UPI0035B5FCA8
MSQSQKALNISNLVVQCGGLASIMENALGPHGRSVLMERSGSVIITQDGIELLSSLAIGDPLLTMVTKGILDQSKVRGDGSKRTLLLLRSLLRSLEYHVSLRNSVSQSVRRQRMLQIITFLKKYMLSVIQRQVFENGVQAYPLHNFEILGKILSYSAESFFSTKFSKLISKTLAGLFKLYLTCQCSSSDDVVRLLGDKMINPQTAIVEIYNAPLLKSSVTPGFVLTRDFKHLDQSMPFENLSCILWSIELEDVKEGPSNITVEVADSESMIDCVMMRNVFLTKCLSLLKSMRVCLIFSSVYFPDWAVLQCRKFGFSVIDMIDAEEWNFIVTKLRVSPVGCINDICPDCIRSISKIEPIILGNSHFIRLFLTNVHQIILYGPTVSQCKQFSSAFCKLFRYMHHWIMDGLVLFKLLREEKCVNESLESGQGSSSATIGGDPYYLTTVNSDTIGGNGGGISSYLSTSDPLPLFYSVPPGAYVALLAKFLVLEDHVSYRDGVREVGLSVLLELLNEIPYLLYKKSRLPQERYIIYNTTFNSHSRKLLNSSDSYSINDLLTDLKFEGYESPFVFFKILDSVFTFAHFVLKIEHIVPSKSKLPKTINCHEETSDDEAS